MAQERTFAIIKPDAVAAGVSGQIIQAIEDSGLKIIGLKRMRLTTTICQGFYHEHISKGFYAELEGFMTEGPVVLMCLSGDDAIKRWRDLMGPTNPSNASEGSLRKRFGTSIGRNATHGSDSHTSAAFEVSYFFNSFELN